jgi:hypothetical protein
MVQGGNKPDGSLKDLWLGIALTFGIYLIGATLLPTIFGNFLIGLIVAVIVHIGVIVLSFVKGRKRLGQGLLIGLGIALLLVAACFGILFTSFGP